MVFDPPPNPLLGPFTQQELQNLWDGHQFSYDSADSLVIEQTPVPQNSMNSEEPSTQSDDFNTTYENQEQNIRDAIELQDLDANPNPNPNPNPTLDDDATSVGSDLPEDVPNYHNTSADHCQNSTDDYRNTFNSDKDPIASGHEEEFPKDGLKESEEFNDKETLERAKDLENKRREVENRNREIKDGKEEIDRSQESGVEEPEQTVEELEQSAEELEPVEEPVEPSDADSVDNYVENIEKKDIERPGAQSDERKYSFAWIIQVALAVIGAMALLDGFGEERGKTLAAGSRRFHTIGQ